MPLTTGKVSGLGTSVTTSSWVVHQADEQFIAGFLFGVKMGFVPSHPTFRVIDAPSAFFQRKDVLLGRKTVIHAVCGLQNALPLGCPNQLRPVHAGDAIGGVAGAPDRRFGGAPGTTVHPPMGEVRRWRNADNP